jgi:hypothetical protein
MRDVQSEMLREILTRNVEADVDEDGDSPEGEDSA